MPEINFNIIWTESAFSDLDEIIDFIAANNIDKAIEIFNSLKLKVKKLEKNPLQGRTVPELQLNNILNYRELVIHPWRIIYRIEVKIIYILAVFDGRRNIHEILINRLLKG